MSDTEELTNEQARAVDALVPVLALDVVLPDFIRALCLIQDGIELGWGHGDLAIAHGLLSRWSTLHPPLADIGIEGTAFDDACREAGLEEVASAAPSETKP